MEKVTVQIGINNITPSKRREYAEWLAETFEMSTHRAFQLVDKISNADTSSSRRTVDVVINYRQLARYTAKRQVENLIKVWSYPLVIDHVEEQTEEPRTTVELRPEYRTK